VSSAPVIHTPCEVKHHLFASVQRQMCSPGKRTSGKLLWPESAQPGTHRGGIPRDLHYDGRHCVPLDFAVCSTAYTSADPVHCGHRNAPETFAIAQRALTGASTMAASEHTPHTRKMQIVSSRMYRTGKPMRPLSRHERQCPHCAGVAVRIENRGIDSFWNLMFPRQRFRCRLLGCGWEGNLPVRKALTSAQPPER
jgi:hypothetical protein